MVQQLQRARPDDPVADAPDTSALATPAATALAPRRRFPKVLLGLVGLLGLLAYGRLLLWDPGSPGLPDLGWFFFGWSDTSPQLVFALTGVLLYQRRRRLAAAARVGRTAWPGAGLLAVAVALFLWGKHVGALDLHLASLACASLGAAWLLFGTGLAGALVLPLLLLLFALPLPAILTNQILFPLQLAGATHAAWALDALGIPSVREGDLIYLADRTFEVIETCSGLRSIEVLTLLAVAWASVFPAGALHAALLIASAPLIAYGVNVARILSLVLNPESEVSAMHAVQGVALFLAGFLILYGVDGLLRRLVKKPNVLPEEAAPELPLEESHRILRRRTLALAGVLGLMLTLGFAVPRWSPKAAEGGWPSLDLPSEVAGWRAAEKLSPDRMFLGSVTFLDNAYRYRRYEGGTGPVEVFLGYDHRVRRDLSVVSPKHAFPGRGWEVEEQAGLDLGPDLPVVRAVRARSKATRVLSFYWYEGAGSLLEEVGRAWLGTDRSALRRPTGALVVRLSTEVAATADGPERAAARLRDFAASLRPGLIAGWAGGS